MTHQKKRVTKPAALGFIGHWERIEDNHLKRPTILEYTSDEAYFNWLSRITDDNPDYAKTT